MQIGTAYSKGGKYVFYSFIYRSDHLWHLEKLRTADSGLLSQQLEARAGGFLESQHRWDVTATVYEEYPERQIQINVTLNVYPRLLMQSGVVLYPSVFLIPKNNLKKPASILGVLQTTIFIICTSLSAKEHQPYSQCNEQQWQYDKQCFGWHTGNTYKNTGKTEYERRKFWTSRSVPSHHKNTSRQLKLLHFIP